MNADTAHDSPWLAATLPVLRLAVSSIEAVRRAAMDAGVTGRLTWEPIDPERVAASYGSDKLFRHKGTAAVGFAPMSGFFLAADGWVRTHGNYPHHASRLASILEIQDMDRETMATAIRSWRASDLEDLAARKGAIAVRVRTEQEWRHSEAGRAAARGDLVEITVREDSAPLSDLIGGEQPLQGLKVLDMTRVIAGPVCTRALALMGAEVLRIDPPDPAEILWQHLDLGQGKRSAILDLRVDLERAQRLLDSADVLVTGYRPGAIERFGLRVPAGLIRARINAWGDHGPWAGRRGFDSIVQAASGVAMIESADGSTPGALPAQALDHSSGYLMAAGIIRALVGRANDGHGRDVRVALARTAQELLDAPGRDPEHPAAARPSARAAVTHDHVITARPAVPGHDDYPFPAHAWGADPAAWRTGGTH